jgi:hypothetical protein
MNRPPTKAALITATLAVVKELAGVRGHVLCRPMGALKAGDCGIRDQARNYIAIDL